MPDSLKQKLGEALSTWKTEEIMPLFTETIKHGMVRLEVMRQNGIKI